MSIYESTAEPTSPAPAPVAVGPGPMTVSELFEVCWRRRNAFILGFVAVVAAVLAVCLRIQPLYEAGAQIEVLRGRAPLTFSDDRRDDLIDFAQLNTQRERITAAPVLQDALLDEGLRDSPVYQQALRPIALLRDRLGITTSRDSRMIALTLRDEDPTRARLGLQAIMKAYLKRLQDRDEEKVAGALVFLREQLDRASERVTAAQTTEQDFRATNSLVTDRFDESPPARELAALMPERFALDHDQISSQVTLDQIDAAHTATGPAFIRRALLSIAPLAAVAADRQKAIEELDAEGRILAERFGPRHPRMVEHQTDVAARTGQLDEVLKMAEAGIRAQHEGLVRRGTLIDVRVAEATSKLESHRLKVIRLQQLVQETSTQQRLFEELQRRLAEEQVISHLESREVVINNPSEVGTRPVNRPMSLFGAAALVFGLGAGIVAALLRESLERRVNGMRRATTLTRLAPLASIPLCPGLSQLGAGVDPEHPAEIAEGFRALRAALRLALPPSSHARCLAVCGVEAGDGCSTVAARLAVSLASAGHRVLLINADMRKPTLDEQMAPEVTEGLAQVLAGTREAEIHASPYPRIDYLGCGPRPANPAELLHSTGLPGLVAQARVDYDYVVFDTPPLSRYSDAILLCSLVDAVLLVLRDQTTQRGALAIALDRLAPVREKVIGLVLNGEQGVTQARRSKRMLAVR